jgi:hypothetical protein
MRLATRLLFVLGTLVSLSALAHKDTPIELTAAGDLRGLPRQYQPARLLLPDGNRKSVRLELGKVAKIFPVCLSQFFLRSHVFVSASWYNQSSLPPYLNIRLDPREPESSEGWSLLIDMNTGGVLYFHRLIETDNGRGQRSENVDLTAICTPEERSQLEPKASK